MKLKYPLLIWCLLITSVAWAAPIDSLENALKTAQGEAKVKVLNELFRAHINSDPVKAIGYTREALGLATEVNDEKGQAACYNNLGVAYRSQGALDKALEYYLNALALYTKIENKEGMATTKNNIGTIYSMKKDFAQAMKFFEESNAVFVELGNQEKIIGSMNNLGNLHSDLQLYEQALKYYSEAYEMSEKAGKIFSDPLNNIGNLYFKQGNYQRAVEYYQKALVLADRENDKISRLNILTNLGEIFNKAGQSQRAQSYLDSAMRLSNELQAFIFEPQILKSMSENYARQNKMKEAYDARLKYDVARERIYGEESSRKIAQMEIALDLHEKEKELDQLKMEDKVKSLELKNSRMVITLIVLAIIAGFAGFNLFYSKRKASK